MSASRTHAGGALLLTVGLAVGACTGGASAEVSGFCDDYLAVDALIASGPGEGDPAPWVEQTTTGLKELEAKAPDEVASAVTAITDGLLEPLANLDQEAYFAATESDEFRENTAVVDEFVAEECAIDTIAVTAVDYAYDGDFEEIEAGRLAFDFTNTGAELHEMALIRINEDTAESIDELLALPEEEAETKTSFMGVSFAPPGEGDVMYADLEAGRYAVVCFIPTGSTSLEEAETADGPPHFTQGMVREFTVEG